MPLFRCSDEFRAVFENRGRKQVLSCLRHIGKREEPGDVVAGDVTRMIIVQFATPNTAKRIVSTKNCTNLIALICSHCTRSMLFPMRVHFALWTFLLASNSEGTKFRSDLLSQGILSFWPIRGGSAQKRYLFWNSDFRWWKGRDFTNWRMWKGKEYRKIPKISPGAYIFQRPFLRGLFLEGLIFGEKFAFQNRFN